MQKSFRVMQPPSIGCRHQVRMDAAHHEQDIRPDDMAIIRSQINRLQLSASDLIDWRREVKKKKGTSYVLAVMDKREKDPFERSLTLESVAIKEY